VDPRPEVGSRGEWFDVTAGEDVQGGGGREERGQDPGHRDDRVAAALRFRTSPTITPTRDAERGLCRLGRAGAQEVVAAVGELVQVAVLGRELPVA